MKKAKILTAQNRNGLIFKIGGPIKFFGKKYKILKLRTDSGNPAYMQIHSKKDNISWVMAQVGNGHWINIDFATKK